MKFIFIKLFYILILFCFYKNIKSNINVLLNNDIINNTNNKIDANYIKSLKKVVYSALIGSYDKVPPIIKQDGYDYFLFTDIEIDNKTTNWTILNINEKMNYSNKIELIKKQRFFKILPHLFFKDYDLSIYIDTTFKIIGDLDHFLLRILSPKLSIYILEHPFIGSINNEFKAVLKSKKDLNSSIIKLKNRYKSEKFPDNNGHAECCLIIRKHNNKKCINIMENWFREIRENSHRDQLSFNYILWKIDYKSLKYISKKYIFEYFKQELFHLKKFEFHDK